MAIITALAGVNGAGKSSVAGGRLRSIGADYFNPDEEAAAYLANSPTLAQQDANSRAWRDGKALLEFAIRSGHDHTFETTLGGESIARLLEQAAVAGHEVCIIFVGLESVEKHIERVRARVAVGGHDIPDDTIRVRYRNSRLNLVRLLPLLDEVVVFDNSEEADPVTGRGPSMRRLLHMKRGEIIHIERKLDAARAWAKPILAAAMELPPRAPR